MGDSLVGAVGVLQKYSSRRRRKRQSNSALSFLLDLTSEILLRLPARSVVRFCCVSKLWSSIITDPYFINLFDTRSSTLQPSLLITFKKGDKFFISSIPQPHQISSPQPTYRYHMKLSKHRLFSPTESVHGLICFQESETPIVWNPTKNQFLTLPKPDTSWNNITLLLGYDPIEGKHKLVCIPTYSICDVCQVLTLGSAQKSWRMVKTNHKQCLIFKHYGRCIKGVIYYVAYSAQMSAHVMMSFDVRFENFDTIQLASDNAMLKGVLITYKERLACFDKNNGARLWVLEDAEKHKWSRQDFLVPFVHVDKRLNTRFELTGSTHAGEFIYVPPTFHESLYILFCDPVRNSCRRFKVEGIADGEYSYVKAFPNHIDTLMSL